MKTSSTWLELANVTPPESSRPGGLRGEPHLDRPDAPTAETIGWRSQVGTAPRRGTAFLEPFGRWPRPQAHRLTRAILRVVIGGALIAGSAACTLGASPVVSPGASPAGAVAAPTTATCPSGASGVSSTAAPASDTATNYLALGDSLTVGYQPSHGEDRAGGFVGAVLQDWRCGHPGAPLTNLACFGENATGMTTGGGSGCSYPEGSQFAAALASLRKNSGAGLVTLTLGTADVFPCTHAGIDQTCVTDRLRTLDTNLTSILSQLRAAAPSARIVVLTCYNPLLATYAGDPDTPSTDPAKLVSPPIAAQSTEMFAQLNRTLAVVATKIGARVADVSAAFAATDTTGSPLPVNVQRLCDWTWLCRVGDTHPNDTGYAVMARAVIAAT